MSDRFRWGILGTGNIAGQFARDLKSLPGHELVSVASRDPSRAAKFCADHGGDAAESYDALLDDVGLDGIYLSLPNTLHAEWTIKALKAGHNVLCEKPLATSLAEAESMFAAAKKAKKTLIEAFMYRCHPQTKAVVAAVRRGNIGDLRTIKTSFAFRVRNTSGNIRFDPALAGGALMDVGCYCLNFSMLLADAPLRSAHAASRVHESGVDVATSGVLDFDNGVLATFACAMDAQDHNAATISGSEGYITVAVPWKPNNDAAGYTLCRGVPPRQDAKPGETPTAPPPEFVATPADFPLYALEARAFAATVRGKAEPFMPEIDSLTLAAALERLRSPTPPARAGGTA